MKKYICVLLLGVSTFVLAQTTELALTDGSKITVKTDQSGTVVTKGAGTPEVTWTATRETNHAKAVLAAKADAEKNKTPVVGETTQ